MQDTSEQVSAKKVIDLDDGLIDEELNSVPYNSDIPYNEAHKAFNEDNEGEANYENDDGHPENKAAGDAKTPLPKPKKPPNLPS